MAMAASVVARRNNTMSPSNRSLSKSSMGRRRRLSLQKSESAKFLETVAWVLGALEKGSPFFQQNPPRSIPHLSPRGTWVTLVDLSQRGCTARPYSLTLLCFFPLSIEIEVGKVLGEGEFGIVSEVGEFKVSESCHCSACLQEAAESPPPKKLEIIGMPLIDKPTLHQRMESAGSRVSFADVPVTINEVDFAQNSIQQDLEYSDDDDSNGTMDFEEREERGFMRAHCKRGGLARYAVKRVKDDCPLEMKEDAAIDLATEAKFLASFTHPNIIKLRAIVGVPGDPDFFLVMDRLYDTLDQRMVRWREAEKRYKGFMGHFGRRKDDLEHVRVDRLVALYDVARAIKYLHKYK